MYNKTLSESESKNAKEILDHILSDQLNVLKGETENQRTNWDDLMELQAKDQELNLLKNKDNKIKPVQTHKNRNRNNIDNTNPISNVFKNQQNVNNIEKMNENNDYNDHRRNQTVNLSRIELDDDNMNDESLINDIQANLNLAQNANTTQQMIPSREMLKWDAILNPSQGRTVKLELDERIWEQFQSSQLKDGSNASNIMEYEAFKDKMLKEQSVEQIIELYKSQVEQDLTVIQNDESNSKDQSNFLMEQSTAPKTMTCPVCQDDFLFDGLPKDNLDKLSITLHACYHNAHYLCILRQMKSLNKTTGECFECRKPQITETYTQLKEFCKNQFKSDSIASCVQQL